MSGAECRIRTADPLAQAIQDAPLGNPRVITVVAGEFFILERWSLEWDNGTRYLKTSWAPLNDAVARVTIPLRYTLAIRLRYWRHKLFGRSAPAR